MKALINQTLHILVPLYQEATINSQARYQQERQVINYRQLERSKIPLYQNLIFLRALQNIMKMDILFYI